MGIFNVGNIKKGILSKNNSIKQTRGEITMENVIEERTVNTYTIKIYQDEDPLNPREEWENFGNMVCFHKRYILGDKHKWDVESFREFLEENEKNIICLNLYLYDHSGITMSYSPFSCAWDSGCIGIIYVTYEEIRKEYGIKRITEVIKEKVINRLTTEIEIYDRYLTGEVYGYVIEDSEGENIDSCWGYYEDPDSIIKYCEEYIIKNYDYQLSLGV